MQDNDQSMILVQNKIERNINGITLQIVMQSNLIEFSYANHNNSFFSIQINEETYKKYVGDYFILFPELSIFKMLITQQDSQMLLQNQKNLIIILKHPFTKKNCQIKVELQHWGRAKYQQYKKQIKSLKIELENKKLQLNKIEVKHQEVIDLIKQNQSYKSLMSQMQKLKNQNANEETFEIKINSIIMKIKFLDNQITLYYTNQKFQTFQKKITNSNITQTVGEFQRFFFNPYRLFKLLKSQKYKIQMENETNFIIQFKLQFDSPQQQDRQILIKLQRCQETKQDLLSKQILHVKADLIFLTTIIKKFEDNKKKQIEEIEQKYQGTINENNKEIKKLQSLLQKEKNNRQQQIKQRNQNFLKAQEYCRQQLQNFYNESSRYKPQIRQKLLSEKYNFNDILPLVMPNKFKSQLQFFKRLYHHEPKYILSVFGGASTGKSTFLTQLMQNTNDKNQKKSVFPQSDNPLTFYDTFYCYNKNTKESQLEIAKDVYSRDIIHVDSFQYDRSQMTLLLEDQIDFKKLKQGQVNLTLIQQEARESLKQLRTFGQKLDRFQNKYMIIRCNQRILYDKDNKYDYLNKYVVLMDRAGIDDGIFDMNITQKIQLQKNQLQRIKNQTVFYCVPGQNLMTADNVAKNHMLNLLNTHDFQKIIMCVNCRNRFEGQVQKKQQFRKLIYFFKEMFVTIPNHMKGLLETKIHIMVERVQQIHKYIENNVGNLKKFQQFINGEMQQELSKNFADIQIKCREQQRYIKENKLFYVEDRKLRIQINKFKDYLDKYLQVCKRFNIFYQGIKNQTENSQKLEGQIIKMIDIYPFQNIRFFGLQNYAKKYKVINILRETTVKKCKQIIGQQSMRSLHRFYQNQIGRINDFHYTLEEYYTHLTISIRKIQQLSLQQQKNYSQNEILHLFNTWQVIAKCYDKISEVFQKYKSNVQNEKKNNEARQKKKKIHINQLKEMIIRPFDQHKAIIKKEVSQLKKSIQIYHSNLKRRIDKKVGTYRPLLQKSYQKIFQHICNDLKVDFQKSLLPLVKLWNKIVASANQRFDKYIKNKNISLKIPNQIAFFESKSQQQQTPSHQKQYSLSFFQKVKSYIVADEQNEISLDQILDSFSLFLQDSEQIGNELKSKISEIKLQITNKQLTLIKLLQKKQENAIEKDKKIIQDIILEIKSEYTKKLTKINYDMILNRIDNIVRY